MEDKSIELVTAARDGDFSKVKLLIESGMDVNSVHKKNGGYTALHYAAFQGFTEMTQYLLVKGAKTSIGDLNGTTPLHVTCEYGRLDIVQMLVEHKAIINAKDTEGNTPLFYAQKYKYAEVARYLISKGAK